MENFIFGFLSALALCILNALIEKKDRKKYNVFIQYKDGQSEEVITKLTPFGKLIICNIHDIVVLLPNGKVLQNEKGVIEWVPVSRNKFHQKDYVN